MPINLDERFLDINYLAGGVAKLPVQIVHERVDVPYYKILLLCYSPIGKDWS